MTKYFEDNFTNFEIDRMIGSPSMLTILVYPSDGGNVFSKTIFDQITELDALIRNATITFNNTELQWNQLCATTMNGRCMENDILKLNQVLDDVENGDIILTYPVLFHPETFDIVPLAGIISNPVMSNEDEIISSKGITLIYVLNSETQDHMMRYVQY
jgi:hypothetical protein